VVALLALTRKFTAVNNSSVLCRLVRPGRAVPLVCAGQPGMESIHRERRHLPGHHSLDAEAQFRAWPAEVRDELESFAQVGSMGMIE